MTENTCNDNNWQRKYLKNFNKLVRKTHLKKKLTKRLEQKFLRSEDLHGRWTFDKMSNSFTIKKKLKLPMI